MKIFLIGMPGAGKSTLGKELAEKIMLPFFDLDKVIESNEGKAIPDIFHESGEKYFRKVEATHLRTVSERNHSFVMATGGGTPCFYDSIAFMKQQGKILFIDSAIKILFERIKKADSRPLLKLESDEQAMERLERLRKERIPFYNQAHFIIEGETSLQQIIEVVLKKENQ